MIRVYICRNPNHAEIAHCGEVLQYEPNAQKPKLDNPPICNVCHHYMELLTKPNSPDQ